MRGEVCWVGPFLFCVLQQHILYNVSELVLYANLQLTCCWLAVLQQIVLQDAVQGP
jgi:hypothetical protein